MPATKVAGLPNITGTKAIRKYVNLDDSFQGALGGTIDGFQSKQNPVALTASPDSSPGTLKFDASKSNSIYGSSNTVQPPSICLIPQLRY